MKSILLISGSPRLGNSVRFCSCLSKELSKTAFSVDVIELSKVTLQFCNGCLLCEDESYCPINDDIKTIKEKMVNADTICFVTPVYFDNLPGKLKTLLDRSNLFMSELKGKQCGAFLCGQADEQSWENCAKIIQNYAEICEMEFIGYFATKARNKDDLNGSRLTDAVDKLISLMR